nr:DUF58 domain-containing protein [Nakamurella aerolata]
MRHWPKRRPVSDPHADSEVGDAIVSGSRVRVRTTLTGLDDAELVTVRLPDTTERPTGLTKVIAGADGATGGSKVVDVDVDSRSWGTTRIARPDLLAAGPDGLLATAPVTGRELVELVLPAAPRQRPLPLPPIDGGWAGAHLSRRPGQGNDLVDLRDFVAGDRMRAVHWRAYARLGKLYTRRTLSDADAELTLCLDLRTNLAPRVPPPPIGWVNRMAASLQETIQLLRDRRSERAGGPGTKERLDARERARYGSLDHTARAAAAIAATQIGAGDRVGMLSVTGDRRPIRSGGGNRHLQRIRYELATMRVSPLRLTPAANWHLRPGAIVLLLSPLNDDDIVEAARAVRGRGHQLIVVDTLPRDEIVRAATAPQLDHLRVVNVQRELRIDHLKRHGIPVLHWADGHIETQLAAAIRLTRTRR